VAEHQPSKLVVAGSNPVPRSSADASGNAEAARAIAASVDGIAGFFDEERGATRAAMRMDVEPGDAEAEIRSTLFCGVGEKSTFPTREIFSFWPLI
jgi:hypothetical protein